MSAIETQVADIAAVTWSTANQEYLRTGLARLRLLLERRILWQRKVWKHSLAKEPQSFQGLIITDSEADLLLNPDDADAEVHFYEHDAAARAISQKVSELTHPAEETAQGRSGLPALEIVARLFHLGQFERDVVLLCLAAEIDAGFERLYAYVQDDANRKYPTANLAVQILGSFYFGDMLTAREHLWDRFAPEAPLCRFRLLRCEWTSGGSWGNEPLRLDCRIGSYLLGVNFLDEQVGAFVRLVEDVAPLSAAQDDIVKQLEHRLRTWSERDQVPATNLVSREPGTAKAIARHLCSRVGLALFALDPTRLSALASEREACYRLLERESMLLPCAYYLDCPDAGAANRGEANNSHSQSFGQTPADALEVARGVRAILFAGSPEPLSGEKSFITVRVPQSDAQAQFAVWQARLGDQLPGNGSRAAFLARLVQQFHFGPQQIHRVVRSAMETAALRNSEAPTLNDADLWLAARGQAVRSMEGLAEKIEARRGFDDLVLPAEAMQQLRDIASQVEQRDRVYEQWGFGAKLSRGSGIVALFAGPSGTGKTMAAEVLAHRLDLDLYRIDLAGVISKFIGETEKNLKCVFDAAEQSGAILFFDEADALFGKRSEVRDSHDRYANIEINYLLQRMEDYRGLAILATNRKSLLDQAFLRRLRFLIDFPLPSMADRLRIWRGAFPAQAQMEPLDYELLGRLEVSGGSISNIALNAAFLAASEQTAIGMNHVLVAARREYSKIDKLMLESEFGRYYKAVRR
jgi:Winged helix domain, variant/ATPase family associated with various cellular activities (AAA)